MNEEAKIELEKDIKARTDYLVNRMPDAEKQRFAAYYIVFEPLLREKLCKDVKLTLMDKNIMLTGAERYSKVITDIFKRENVHEVRGRLRWYWLNHFEVFEWKKLTWTDLVGAIEQ